MVKGVKTSSNTNNQEEKTNNDSELSDGELFRSLWGFDSDMTERKIFRKLRGGFRKDFKPSWGGNFLDIRGRREGVMREKMGGNGKTGEGFKRGGSSFNDT